MIVTLGAAIGTFIIRHPYITAGIAVTTVKSFERIVRSFSPRPKPDSVVRKFSDGVATGVITGIDHAVNGNRAQRKYTPVSYKNYCDYKKTEVKDDE